MLTSRKLVSNDNNFMLKYIQQKDYKIIIKSNNLISIKFSEFNIIKYLNIF